MAQWPNSGHVGLLMCLLSFGRVMPGAIEIVEEQECDGHEFRLTCRDLDTHIAILEAWFTPLHPHKPTKPPYHPRRNTHPTRSSYPTIIVSYPSKPTSYPIKPNNEQLNQVYVYSSPMNNGLFQENITVSEMNITDFDNVNETDSVNSANVEDVNRPDKEEFILDDDEVEKTFEAAESEDEVVSESERICEVDSFVKSYPSSRAHEFASKGLYFTPNVSVNLRSSISYRCAGKNHCSYQMSADDPVARAERWGRGAVYIKYACFDQSSSTRWCNRAVRAGARGEGYLRTPGYPQYYVGEQRCLWRVIATPGHRLRVTLVDVSLRSMDTFESDCTDRVRLVDGSGEQLLTTCSQPDLPRAIETKSNVVRVLIETRSRGPYPKRGVLLHYKSIDCVTPAAPRGGYLVYRSERTAFFMCSQQTVFPDTRQRARVLFCIDDNRWNDTLPKCKDKSALSAESGDALSPTDANMPPNDNSMIVDIVIPSLLIAALFIGNAFIVLIIYKYRKRKNEDIEEDLNTIPLSVNGTTVHTAGNAV